MIILMIKQKIRHSARHGGQCLEFQQLEAETGGFLGVHDQPGLHSDIQASLSYHVRLISSKQTKMKGTEELERWLSS